MDEIFDRLVVIWAKIKGYIISVIADWKEGRKIRAVGKVISPCLPVVLVGLIVNFVVKHWDAIVSFFIVVITLFCIIGGILNSYSERRRTEAERKERQRQEAIREKARTMDGTYKKMAKVVWEASRTLGPLGIIPPNRLEDIYSPGRMVTAWDGEVMFGLYLLQKAFDTVDADLVKDTMQTKVDQGLTAGKFPDIPNDLTYNGRVYSGFTVDAVKDSRGFVEVYTVLTDESYCQHKLEGDLEKDAPPPSVDRRDVDY